MATRSALQIGALSGFLMASSVPARAEGNPPETTETSTSIGITHSDILTDRLSPKQLSVWKSLVSAIHARSKNGRLLYAKLHCLWQAAVSAGQPIYIELPERNEGVPEGIRDSFRSTAGKFVPASTDQDGKVHPAVIRIDRYTIDSGTPDMRDDGFEPLKGLGKKERYLEVLGHELAHAIAVFQDPEYAEKFQMLEKEVAGHVEFWQTNRKMPGAAEELRRRGQSISALTKVLEAPARAAEIEVWRELSQKGGTNPVDAMASAPASPAPPTGSNRYPRRDPLENRSCCFTAVEEPAGRPSRSAPGFDDNNGVI